ncbi:MAG TPA: cobaltochelatase subunit CobN, partial [Conexibacter sp.]|nr:cobaltochelatase subunit CobN [Conexibacter sp.]
MLRLISTADTEILAAAHARRELGGDFPEVRCAQPMDDPAEFVAGARAVVVRLLGGRRAWPEGLAKLRAACERDGIALLALGGEAEPDPELAELSLAPAGAVAQAFEYLRHGGVENTRALLSFLADTFVLTGYGFAPPRELAEFGMYAPADPDGRPRVGVVFYRSHFATGNTAFVDALAGAIERAGGQPVCVWAYSLRGDAPAL